jgi:hypothetical protein
MEDKMMTLPKPVAIEEKPEQIRQWLIECPLEESMAEADIAVRPMPLPHGLFSVILWKIKNCSFWPKRAGCYQRCIRKL